MISIENAKEEFLKYVNKFNLNDENINRKIYHSLRVMEISRKIAKSLNLEQEYIELAELIGLLHDIGRFEQRTKYQTFSDLISIDHGDLGVKILKKNCYIRKYIDTEKFDKIIFTAIENHNKYSICNGLDAQELLFSKIIRDADKIDILFEGTEIFWKNEEKEVEKSILSEYASNNFLNKQTIKKTNTPDINKKADGICTQIAFIFDINFEQSFKILKNEDYINKIINRFEFKDTNTKEKMDKIREIANVYIAEKVQ